MSKAWVYDWFLRFKCREMSFEDQPHFGRHSISKSEENIDKINTFLYEDYCQTVRHNWIVVKFNLLVDSLSQICRIFGIHGISFSTTTTMHLLTPCYLLNSI